MSKYARSGPPGLFSRFGKRTALMALTSVEVILKNLQELFHKKEGGAA